MNARYIVWPAVIAAGVLAPWFIASDFYLKLIFSAAVYYLAASGLNVLVGWAGQKSLGHAGLFAAGAYTAALLTTSWQWNPWLAFLAAGVVAAGFGVLIAIPSLRVRGPSLAMVTIGFGIVVEKIVTEWEVPFGGQAGIYGVLPLTVAGRPLDMREWAWAALAIALIAHVLLDTLLKGKYGRAFQAVQAAEIAAESIGINVHRMKVLAFVISAVTCGLAGAMVAQQNQYINSDFITFNLSIFLLLIVLFGGPSIYGPALGAIALTLLDAFLARWPALQHFTYGALLLVALYVMPQGLAGALQGIWRRITPIPARSQADDALAPATLSSVGPVDATVLGTELLKVRDLYKRYGGVVPVNQVSATLNKGHVHALIGPNGAGKTTFLNLISGTVAADRGAVEFAGREIGALRASEVCKAGIARTFQNLRLFPHMSVLDNVRVGLHCRQSVGFLPCLLGLPSARAQERAAHAETLAILKFAGLLDRAHAPAGSLPYGLQRRLELARALATRPNLLLLDEPAAGLNPQETAELVGLIRRIRDLGITICLIEHHMDLVMAVSDHVIVLDYGMKISEGAPDAVRRDKRVIEAYLGASDEGETPVETPMTQAPSSHALPQPAV